jgi:hypothetical protein
MGKFWNTLDTGTKLALCRFAEGGPTPTALQIHADDLHKLVHIDDHTREAARKLGLAELEVGKAKEKLFKAITQRLEGDIATTVEAIANRGMITAFCVAMEKLLQLLPTAPKQVVGLGLTAIMAPCEVELAPGIGDASIDLSAPMAAAQGLHFTYMRVGPRLRIFANHHGGAEVAPGSAHVMIMVMRRSPQ